MITKIKILVLAIVFPLFSTSSYAAPFAYVGNFNDSALSIIDTADNTVVTTLNIGTNPYGVAVHPDGSQAYVSNLSGPEEVKIIASDTHTISGVIPVGNQPAGIAVTPDGSSLYVASRANGTVSVIDIATKAIVDTITVGAGAEAIAINPAGTFVYVANTNAKTVSVIDTSNNTVVDTLNIGLTPLSLAFNRSGSRVYIASGDEFEEPQVLVVDPSDNSILSTIDLPLESISITVHPLENPLYVSNESKIFVIDTATNTISITIEPPKPVGSIDVNPAGTFLYAATMGAGDGIVYVIDTQTNTVVAEITVGAALLSSGRFIGPAPALSLSRDEIDFGDQVVDEQSGEESATLTNIGSLTLDIDSIDVDLSDFLLDDDCPLELLSNDFCTVTVTFEPLTEGAQTGKITIVSNTNESPHTITVTGTGVSIQPVGGCSLIPKR